MFVWSWPKAELERRRDIGLSICRQKWDPPSFVLHTASKAEARSSKDIRVHRNVILAPTLWNMAGVEDAVAKFEPDFIAWTEPIVRLDLFPLCGTADPCSNEVSAVGVPAEVLRVPIVVIIEERERVGISAFQPEVQLWSPR